MKISAITCALMFLYSLTGTSQSLLDTNKLWTSIFVGFPPTYLNTTIVKLSGDTVISGKTYLKMYYTHDPPYTQWQFRTFLRETADGKVYSLHLPYDTVDRLTYDFNYVTGDTVRCYTMGTSSWQHSMVVTHDSLVFIAGMWRKELVFNAMPPDFGVETWLAGIGSMLGLQLNGCSGIVGGANHLCCYFENDSLLYHHPDYPLCYYDNTFIDNPEQDESGRILIRPNPCDGIVTIETSVAGEAFSYSSIELYDIFSQKLYSQQISQDRAKIQFDLRKYANGIFFLRFCQSDQNSVIRKLVLSK